MVSTIPQLMERYVDGSLSAPEMKDFLDRLHADPLLLADVQERLHMHGMLQALQIDDAECDALLGRVERVIAIDQPPIQFENAVIAKIKSRRQKRLWLTVFSTAAAVALFFSLNRDDPQPKPPPEAVVHRGASLPVGSLESPSVQVPTIFVEFPSAIAVGTLSEASGTLWLFTPDERVAASVGTAILSGSTLVSDRNGSGTIELDDGTRFEMSPNTELTVTQADGRYHLFLGTGHLNATVMPQPHDKSMRCDTPNAKLEVLGTRFSINSSYLHTQNARVKSWVTHLLVQEGRVRFGNEAGDALEVSTDESATVYGDAGTTRKAVAELRTEDLKIARATYGSLAEAVDVTEAIRSRVTEHRLILTGLFNDLQGDPHRRNPKTLRIEYVVDGRRLTKTFNEWNEDQSLPMTSITLPVKAEE